MGMEPRWKIAELAEVVGGALASVGQAEQPSGRVRDVPDLRTIRYYTTLGLLDRPLAMKGRTAYYGWRHVWQLLAIKQLQAHGLALVEIQTRLAGADDRTLKKLAQVPHRLVRGAWTAAGQGRRFPEADAPPRRAFWAAEPAIGQSADVLQPVAGASAAACQALHIKLGEGATLVLEGVEPGACDRDKLTAIEPAARGLINQLRQLGVTQPPSAAVAQPFPVVSNTKSAERNRS